MGYVIEVDFFNAYWLKKTTANVETNYLGLGGFPFNSGVSYPGRSNQAQPSPTGPKRAIEVFGLNYYTENPYQWFFEEATIMGKFNGTVTDLGVKAYVNEPNPQQQHRFNSLIYSGVYNSRTGVNDTNVFSVADDLVRSADPQNGTIQLTYAEDTNLIVFQENKVSRALIDKDTIYTTEGGTQTQSGQKVLGQIVPYKGEYGISKNPESFAVYGIRKYFADADRNSILRLSGDGLTEISAYGMTDFFRDELALVKENNSNYELKSTLKQDTEGDSLKLGTYRVDYTAATNLINGTNTATITPTSTGSGTGFTCKVAIFESLGEQYVDITTVTAGSGYKIGDEITLPPTPAVTPAAGWSGNLKFTLNSSILNNNTFFIIPTKPTIIGNFDQNYFVPGMTVSYLDSVSGGFANMAGFISLIKPTSGSTELTIFMSSLVPSNLTAGTEVRFSQPIKGSVRGGFDIHNKSYVVSMQQTPTRVDKYRKSTYKTLSFDEQILGWVSFSSYKPQILVSLKNNFYTGIESNLFEQYDETTTDNRGLFYGVRNKSNVSFVFNPSPSTMKEFKTINYEGSSGWEVNSFVSGFEGPNKNDTTSQDVTNKVYSYEEGLYTNSITGQSNRAGFDRQENRYVANLVSNSSIRPGEVRFGDSITGIKGYFTTVKMETDNSTQLGGVKELWAVGTVFDESNGYT